MANITGQPVGGGSSTTTGAVKSVVAGTSTNWHTVIMWFLGAIAMIALADPAPKIATALVLLVITGALLNNWKIYAGYLGI